MKFKLEIDCSNAAFHDEGTVDEVARIMDGLARRLRADEGMHPAALDEYVLRDINGNKVGTAFFIDV